MSDTDTLKQVTRRLPDFSKREVRTAAFLFLYNFLAMCAFSVVKPVRMALLLDRLGPDWLPVGFMGAAAATGFVVAGASWFARRVPPRFRVLLTTVLLLVNLLGFRLLFELSGDWVALAFYIWCNLFSNILFTQFWLIAGNQFTPREGKRMLGWVSAGATVGGIVGPMVAFMGLEEFGTINLIFCSALFLTLCMPLVFYFENRTSNQIPAAEEEEESVLAGFKLFGEFRHLKLIALISGASMVVQTVLDYQFGAIVDAAFVSADDKAAFFAKFFAGVNVVGLFLQLVLTRFILMRFGVGVALFLLPGALLVGSVGIWFSPTLVVAMAARMAETGTRYSINEATREILYLPLPASVRSKARPVIDIFGARLFEGAGGLMILVFTVWLGISVPALSLFSVALISIWAVTVLSVKHAYVDSLRGLFAEMSVESEARAAEVLDDETVSFLVSGLDSDDEVQVCQNLSLLDLMHDKSDVLPHLKRTLNHPSVVVKGQVLELLYDANEGMYVEEAEQLLSVDDPEVRMRAVRYVGRFGDVQSKRRLQDLVRDTDLRVQVSAVAVMMQSGDMGAQEAMSMLRELSEGDSAGAEAARAEIALVLGQCPRIDHDALLMELLNDESPVVVRAAMEGAARTERRLFVPLLVPHLGDERLMLFAQRALLAYGDRILGTLRDYMDDDAESDDVRRAVPGCLAAIGSQRAAEMLLVLLRDHQGNWGDALVEALSEVQHRNSDITFDGTLVLEAVQSEVGKDGGADHRWIWRITELLGLIYPVDDIRRAYAGLTSGERTLQSNALELLDNLLKAEHKQGVLPRIERWISGDG